MNEEQGIILEGATFEFSQDGNCLSKGYFDHQQNVIQQAKEMEKQQIIDAYLKNRPKATIDKALILWDDAEQYYNETFKIE